MKESVIEALGELYAFQAEDDFERNIFKISHMIGINDFMTLEERETLIYFLENTRYYFDMLGFEYSNIKEDKL